MSVHTVVECETNYRLGFVLFPVTCERSWGGVWPVKRGQLMQIYGSTTLSSCAQNYRLLWGGWGGGGGGAFCTKRGQSALGQSVPWERSVLVRLPQSDCPEGHPALGQTVLGGIWRGGGTTCTTTPGFLSLTTTCTILIPEYSAMHFASTF